MVHLVILEKVIGAIFGIIVKNKEVNLLIFIYYKVGDYMKYKYIKHFLVVVSFLVVTVFFIFSTD